MNFDEAYRDSPTYFGAEPDEILLPHVGELPPGSHVLDVGCGQGRHTFPLAERGIAVDALDPSAEAIAQVEAVVRERGWPVRGIHGTLEEIPAPEEAPYGGVLLMGLFPEITPAAIEATIAKSLSLLRPAGVIWVTAFTTEDPGFEPWRGEAVTSEGNSFQLASGRLRTFLDQGELLRLFEAAARRPLTVLHSWEGLGPEHRHGDGPLERHGRAELVIRVG